MSFERKVGEPKLSKCGTFTTRIVKVGNKQLGVIEAPKLKPGEKPEAIYWTTNTVIRPSASGAFVSVDRTQIAGLAMYGVKKIGNRAVDGSTLCIALDKVQTYPSMGKYLDVPRSAWEASDPPTHQKVANTLASMHISNGRRKSAVT